MSDRKTKRKRHLPQACEGPWHVVRVIAGTIVLMRCETCGAEIMGFKPEPK